MFDKKLLLQHIKNQDINEQEAPADPAQGIGNTKKRPSAMDYGRKLLKTKRIKSDPFVSRDHLDPNYVPPGKRPKRSGRQGGPPEFADPEGKIYRPKFLRKGDNFPSISGVINMPTDDMSRDIKAMGQQILRQKAETDANKSMERRGGRFSPGV